MDDGKYLKRAIRLASKGIGRVNPNPLVGAVIVKDDKIVGEGYHKCYGKEHAEILAIQNAGEKTHGATLYVNLEPCCHHGKTPPCTDAIIEAGIQRVVIGMKDPNPIVNGRGIEILKQNHIEVTVGIEEKACQQLNRVFTKYITTGLPYVTLKIAQSLDGRIATRTGHSQWISSLESRVFSHRLRTEHDAVIVGIKTILMDNPHLTVRHVRGKNPVRIVLDSSLQIPLNFQLLRDTFVNKTVIATLSDDLEKIDQIQATGAQVWQIDGDRDGHINIFRLLKRIANAEMSAVLVEGGAQVYTSFLKEKMVDQIVIVTAPKILGAGIAAIGDLNILNIDESIELENLKIKQSGLDLIISGQVKFK